MLTVKARKFHRGSLDDRVSSQMENSKVKKISKINATFAWATGRSISDNRDSARLFYVLYSFHTTMEGSSGRCYHERYEGLANNY